MLNDVILKVLNKVLDGNVESVDFYFSGWHRVQVIMKSKISPEDFIKKTKRIISETDIGSHDSDDDDESMISLDLTEDFVNKIIAYVKYECLDELENMKKSR